MTFFEAAVEILKESRRPLHYKKITELAVQRSLLSHVGKSPESTMQTLLTDEAKKGDDAAVVLVRNGVFALASHADPSAIVGSLTTTVTLGEPKKKDDGGSKAARPKDEDKAESEESDDAESSDDEEENGGGRSRGRRRRRGRGRGGSGRDGDDDRDKDKASKDSDKDKASKDSDKGDGAKAREAKEDDRSDDDGGRRGRKGKDKRRNRGRRRSGGESGSTDALGAILDVLEDASGARSAEELAEDLGDGTPPLVVEQALAAANAERVAAGAPPVALVTAAGWVSSTRLLGKKLAKRHGELQSAFDSLVEDTVATVSKHLQKLDADGLLAFARAVLVGAGCVVEELDGGDDEVVLRATPSGGLQPFPVAALVRLSDAKLSADDIAAFRGRFDKYGVKRGVVLTPRRNAGKEVEEEAGTSVAVFVADAYANLAVESGVGVTYYNVRVPVPDPAHFGGDKD